GLAYDEAVPPVVGKVITFQLGGNQIIADADVPMIERTPKGEDFGSPEMLQAGMVHFARNCAVCHGQLAVSSGVLPDLRWSPITADQATWAAVVNDGTLSANGMVAFSDVLSDEESEAIRAYVMRQAHNAAAEAESAGGAP
ncbi:MAG: c-type cytochrome, partial [Pseudomonadota bacterium]